MRPWAVPAGLLQRLISLTLVYLTEISMFSGCCDERTVGKPGLGYMTLTQESVLPGDKHTRPDFSTLVSHEPDGVNPLASGRVSGTCCCMNLDCSTPGAPQLTAARLLLEIPSPPVPVHWHQYRPVSWDTYHVSKGKPFPPVLINSWTPQTPVVCILPHTKFH